MTSQNDTKPRSSHHWENYWGGSGNQEDARDAAVTGAGRSEAFQSAWRAFFEDTAKRTQSSLTLMDLACGGGVVTDIASAVFAKNRRMADVRLIGVDYSLSAARQYAARFQGSDALQISGVVGDALSMPFQERCADIVVSQFGIEYAGAEAVGAASRLLAQHGEVMCLTHCRAGAIERECSENLSVASEIISSGVLTQARQLFVDPSDPQGAVQFNATMQALHALAQKNPASAGNRLLTRLWADLTKLIARRAAYNPREAVGWIDANAAEITMYRDRMKSMTEAALDEGQIHDIADRWKADGLDVDAPSAILLDGADAPSAWRLRGRRR